MNVIFMGNFSYPQGMAGTKRVQHFIDYLKKKETKIRVLLLRQGEEKLDQGAGQGIHKGIYYYTVGPDIQMDFSLLFLLPGYFITGFKKLICWKSASKKNILFIYSGLDIENFFFVIFAKIIGYKIVVDIVEDYSYFTDSSHIFSKIKQLSNILIEKILSPLSNGIIVISSYLKRKFEKTGFHKAMVHIPITATKISSRLRHTNLDSNTIQSKVVYSGSFGQKDGVETLIDAFRTLALKRNDCRLFLTGKGKNLPKILNLIKDIDNIHYTGFLEDKDFYSFINKADILCMPRIDSGFSNAGFPFKLGEYLATGNPVIASDIGDVSDYLDHMQDAVLIPPDNSDSIAKAVELLIDNKEHAKKIGIAGLKKCHHFFNPETNGEKVYNFLKQI